MRVNAIFSFEAKNIESTLWHVSSPRSQKIHAHPARSVPAGNDKMPISEFRILMLLQRSEVVCLVGWRRQAISRARVSSTAKALGGLPRQKAVNDVAWELVVSEDGHQCSLVAVARQNKKNSGGGGSGGARLMAPARATVQSKTIPSSRQKCTKRWRQHHIQVELIQCRRRFVRIEGTAACSQQQQARST